MQQELGLEILECETRYMEDYWHFRDLSAPFWRLYLNDRPGAYVVMDGVRTELVPEHFVLIPPDMPFAGEQSAPVNHFFLHFIVRPVHSARPRMYEFDCRPLLRESIRSICESESGSVGVVAMELMLAHFAIAQVPADAFQQTYFDRRVERTIALMRDHMREGLSNTALAREASMNTNAFIRLFREVTGFTPQAYFAKMRIDRSCVLLHHSDRSIEEVAAATGFCDRYHFSRVFKKARNMGPASFRKMVVPGLSPGRWRIDGDL
jgi:AraC-like DNA-binding protein